MSTPQTSRVKKASVSVYFETDSGYESSFGSQNKPGVESLKQGLHEIVSILVINGDHGLVDCVVKAATRHANARLVQHAAMRAEQEAEVRGVEPSEELLRALGERSRPGILHVYRDIVRKQPNIAAVQAIRRAKEMWGHRPLIAIRADEREGIADIFQDVRRAHPGWSLAGVIRETERQWKDAQTTTAGDE